MTDRNCTTQKPSKQPKKAPHNKLTTADFIKRSKAVHGSKYGYEKSIYIASIKTVEIYCKKCQEYFWQIASVHMKGHHCKKCAKKRSSKKTRVSQEEIINRFKKVHGDRYDYSKTNYQTSAQKVIIICKKHGEFEQLPPAHEKGHGCAHCAGCGRRTQKEAIQEFQSVHGDRYDYSLVDYKGVDYKVKIICKKHGVFEQLAYDHMKGYNCRQCSIEEHPSHQIKDWVDVLVDFQRAHGDKYDYSKVRYNGAYTKVEIICKEHGSFFQNPSKHSGGNGCPACGERHRYDHTRKNYIESCLERSDGKSNLYVLRLSQGSEVFYKIGITRNTTKLRFRKLKAYHWEEIYWINGDAGFIFDLEKRLHKVLKTHKHDPKTRFQGYTECFTTIKPVEKLLKELSTTEQLQLLA